MTALRDKLSPELIRTINTLGVEQRYSTLENYPEFLSGKPSHATSSTTQLGVNATRKCIEQWQGDPSKIGLLIAATNTPDQMLPCLASEVMGRTHGLLSRSLTTVSMQAQGCSVLLKSIEVAQWYLAANPGRMAMVLMAESPTPYVAPLPAKRVLRFSRTLTNPKGPSIQCKLFEQQRLDTPSSSVYAFWRWSCGAAGRERGRNRPLGANLPLN